jgi:5-methylcytosine-specific restriction endonuclease McrA
MPIRPENKKLYPDNWNGIRQDILVRAKNKCEFCGAPNYYHAVRYDGKAEYFYDIADAVDCLCRLEHLFPELQTMKIPKIILTIAHLDHDPTNNNYNNLKALCQKCHNNYDMKNRIKNRIENREKETGQITLFNN